MTALAPTRNVTDRDSAGGARRTGFDVVRIALAANSVRPGFPRCRGCGLWVAVVLMILLGPRAQGQEPNDSSPFQMEELVARRAQALRSYEEVYERRIAWHKLSKEERVTQRASCDRILDDYEALIQTYPRTEIAGYCLSDMLALYMGSHDMTGAGALCRRIRSEMPGTVCQLDAEMSMGIRYLQTGEAATALTYFDRVPNPRAAPYRIVRPGNLAWEQKDDELTPEENYYVSAQLNVVKCHLQLHRAEQAGQVLEDLRNSFPAAAPRIKAAIQAIHREILGTPAEPPVSLDHLALLPGQVGSDVLGVSARATRPAGAPPSASRVAGAAAGSGEIAPPRGGKPLLTWVLLCTAAASAAGGLVLELLRRRQIDTRRVQLASSVVTTFSVATRGKERP